jgi:membrane protein YdbS with pleckstrin-like domain
VETVFCSPLLFLLALVIRKYYFPLITSLDFPIQNHFNSYMSITITEKDYPVQVRWIFKWSFSIIFAPIVIYLFYPSNPAFAVGANSPSIIIQVLLYTIFGFAPLLLIFILMRCLERLNFHYALEDKFITVEQGIFSGKQRQIPYGVIQNIAVRQDVIDRILGLASLKFVNTSQAEETTNSYMNHVKAVLGFIPMVSLGQVIDYDASSSWWDSWILPSFGLKKDHAEEQKTLIMHAWVYISGLKKDHAEKLKMFILQKMKENQIDSKIDITS